ncbi:DNA polymerase III subunit delta [Thiorhodovibrio frisius]|uniref:DNA polymerase III subunit delta n=1 Tax=Thiorhodovibrio frisius TaxID=631362 RepID=H8Z2B2_9GAMM|nr:DNA polymerase III subunit delta [Thiorhodovibrio frisius]EIC22674.1 DNA polymerase III, delta subunit [Thiorhodovibrio frisius]WPL22430.1 DNA polymerase III subunit delta [Thiorhodovibrio frisius]
MKFRPDQLEGNLRKGLAPVYLVCGEEPLQFKEVVDAIRARAREKGFSERQVLEQTKDFDWSSLAAEAGNLSLFADQRLIELRVGDKLGREGADAIRAYCDKPSQDVLLLIQAPALGWKDLKTKWAQKLEQVGVIIEVRRLQGPALVKWLDQRLRAKGFLPTPEVAALLAERVEGNLLAADQEVSKLALLLEPGPIDPEVMRAAVADSARYDLFDLTGAALAGDRARTQRIIHGLAGEGTAEPLVLWVLARELRMLAAVAFARRARADLNAVFQTHQVWESRRAGVMQAVERYSISGLWQLLLECAAVDLAIKGRGDGDPWTMLARIADGLARGTKGNK